jgi:hypothetical protein
MSITRREFTNWGNGSGGWRGCTGRQVTRCSAPRWNWALDLDKVEASARGGDARIGEKTGTDSNR